MYTISCVPLQHETYIDSTEQYYIINRLKESLLLTSILNSVLWKMKSHHLAPYQKKYVRKKNDGICVKRYFSELQTWLLSIYEYMVLLLQTLDSFCPCSSNAQKTRFSSVTAALSQAFKNFIERRKLSQCVGLLSCPCWRPKVEF